MPNKQAGVVVHTGRTDKGAIENRRNSRSSSERANQRQKGLLKKGCVRCLVKPAIIFLQACSLDQGLCGAFFPSASTVRVVRRNDKRKAPVNVQTAKSKLGAAVIQAGLFLPLDLKDLCSNSGVSLF